MKKLLVMTGLVAAMTTAATMSAHAQTFPDKPITIVSGFPGGAATDIYARKLGNILEGKFKVAFISENKTGAGGNIASSYVAKAKPDGYTILLGTAGTHAINASLYKKLDFDVVKDFKHVALLGYLPNILLTNPDARPDLKTCQDLTNFAKQNPTKLNYASTGNGASGHLAGVQFSKAANIENTHIPYKGQGPAMTALLGGQVDFFFNQTSPSIPLIKSGKVHAIGITSSKRLEALPNLPTIAEACNLPGFESTTWYGLFAPANVPDDILNKISAAVVETITTPDFKAWLVDQGIQPVDDPSPANFKKIHLEDIKRWDVIVKQSGAQVD